MNNGKYDYKISMINFQGNYICEQILSSIYDILSINIFTDNVPEPFKYGLKNRLITDKKTEDFNKYEKIVGYQVIPLGISKTTEKITLGIGVKIDNIINNCGEEIDFPFGGECCIIFPIKQ